MIKRVFDIVISSMVLIVSSPLLILVSCLIAAKFGSPILFSQNRPGYKGKVFKMYKFRTMLHAVDEKGEPLPDTDRLTPLGIKLRSTSLDELPGLWNVLKGDLSLVGPRPLLVEYLPLYSERQVRRHDVRPGITGWAQVNGRNAISWEQKFEYDVWYVDNQRFWLDLKILFLTLKKVASREGVTADGEATMTRFEGNKND